LGWLLPFVWRLNNVVGIPNDLARRCGHPRQFASVRRIVLDEGPDKGVTAYAFSTGGGFDFWVLGDRAMDIGPLWWRGTSVAWQSPAGMWHPSLVGSGSDCGRGFERGFSGFLMTCGLDHTRQPENGRPLHGPLPFLPARVTAYGEDWQATEPHLFMEGEIIQWRHNGEYLALIRRIEAPIGGTSLRIRDRVENRGIAPHRHALLYHMNIGFPFLRPGAYLSLDGQCIGVTVNDPDPARSPEVGCQAMAGSHGLAVLESGGARLTLGFGSETLPFFQHWHDPRPGSFVLALEPCTSMRPEPGSTADEPILAPGERRSYAIDVSIDGNAA
jgi:Domain of unknown function (DUF4432)